MGLEEADQRFDRVPESRRLVTQRAEGDREPGEPAQGRGCGPEPCGPLPPAVRRSLEIGAGFRALARFKGPDQPLGGLVEPLRDPVQVLGLVRVAVSRAKQFPGEDVGRARRRPGRAGKSQERRPQQVQAKRNASGAGCELEDVSNGSDPGVAGQDGLERGLQRDPAFRDGGLHRVVIGTRLPGEERATVVAAKVLRRPVPEAHQERCRETGLRFAVRGFEDPETVIAAGRRGIGCRNQDRGPGGRVRGRRDGRRSAGRPGKKRGLDLAGGT